MAKALGLIGNFKGKLGNTVGYSLKDSNNKQTQGVRVYQPVVRNPKTAAQAEQRAKLAPINATYRALKMVIDRGQEGKAYGNKSRLAWLSDAMKAFNGGWFEKGAAINMPAIIQVTKGTLPFNVELNGESSYIEISVVGLVATQVKTVGALSTVLMSAFPVIQEGDQLTFVKTSATAGLIMARVESIVINKTSTDAIPSFFSIADGQVMAFTDDDDATAGAVILSREGDNGSHLRSTTALTQLGGYNADTLAPTAKQAAIESYMSQGANTDWAEESLK